MLTFETSSIQGVAGIIEKLAVCSLKTEPEDQRGGLTELADTPVPKSSTPDRDTGCAALGRAGRDLGYGYRCAVGMSIRLDGFMDWIGLSCIDLLIYSTG